MKISVVFIANLIYVLAYAMLVNWITPWFSMETVSDIVWWTALLQNSLYSIVAVVLTLICTASSQKFSPSTPRLFSVLSCTWGAIIMLVTCFILQEFEFVNMSYWLVVNWIILIVVVTALFRAKD